MLKGIYDRSKLKSKLKKASDTNRRKFIKLLDKPPATTSAAAAYKRKWRAKQKAKKARAAKVVNARNPAATATARLVQVLDRPMRQEGNCITTVPGLNGSSYSVFIPSPPLTNFEGNATRSPQPVRYDLIPSSAITALARRLTLGATKHGENNWRLGGEQFRAATISHLFAHLLDFMQSGGSDNLDAILANAAFLVEFEIELGAYVPAFKRQAATGAEPGVSK